MRVETRHVAELTIWFGDGMIDWQQPATVHVDGRAVFTGTLSPDLLLTLTESLRRFDLDRLRWAGLRVREGGDAQPVTATTPFPPLVPGS